MLRWVPQRVMRHSVVLNLRAHAAYQPPDPNTDARTFPFETLRVLPRFHLLVPTPQAKRPNHPTVPGPISI